MTNAEVRHIQTRNYIVTIVNDWKIFPNTLGESALLEMFKFSLGFNYLFIFDILVDHIKTKTIRTIFLVIITYDTLHSSL